MPINASETPHISNTRSVFLLYASETRFSFLQTLKARRFDHISACMIVQAIVANGQSNGKGQILILHTLETT